MASCERCEFSIASKLSINEKMESESSDVNASISATVRNESASWAETEDAERTRRRIQHWSLSMCLVNCFDVEVAAAIGPSFPVDVRVASDVVEFAEVIVF
jgi:hypothetical protein